MTSLLPFTTDIIRAFGWTLLHSFWQAFVVFACLRIVLKIWPAASSAAKYHLSFLSLAGIFTWFVATFWQQMSAIRESKLLVQFVLNSPLPAGMPVNPVPAAAPESNLKWLLPGMEVYFPVLVGVYVIGVSVMTIKLVIDLAQLQQLRRAAARESDNMWEKQLRVLADRMCISTKVRLHISSSVQVPVMIGFIRPLILLPAAMVNNLSTDQLEAILLHELAHIKRHDYLLNIFQTIVETILFFNPFIWWISRNIRIEREHCCDDLVIASTVQPLHYAKALVALEEYRLTSNPMAMAIADNKQYLFHRIKRIMEMKTTHRNYSQQFLALLIILTGVASIAWLNPSQKDKKKQKEQTEAHGNNICSDSLPPLNTSLSAIPPAAFAAFETLSNDAPEALNCPPATLSPMTSLGAMTGAAFEPLAAFPVQSNFQFTSPAPFAMASGFSSFPIFDTIPGKPGKIRITDEKGNVKEYNSINDMPEEDRKKMEEQYVKMQEAQELMKKAQDDMKAAAEKHKTAREQMRVEMAKQQALLQENFKVSGEQYKKMQEEMEKAYKSVNWKKMNDEMQKAYKNIDWKKMNEDMQKAYNSVDWKKINEEMQKAYQNINWDKMNSELQKAYEKVNIEKIIEESKKAGKEIDEQAIRGAFQRNTGSRNDIVIRDARRFRDADRVFVHPNTYARSSTTYYTTDSANNRLYATTISSDDQNTNSMVINRARGGNVYSGNANVYSGGAYVISDAQNNVNVVRARSDRFHDMADKVTVRDAENKGQNLNYRDLVSQMEEDKLINIKKGFEIEKKDGVLYINGAKQSDDVLKKYDRYFKQDKVQVKGSNDNLSVSIID